MLDPTDIMNDVLDDHNDHTDATSVDVVVVDGPPIPPIGALDDALERKRRAAWHNDARNDMVAAIGVAFANCNINKLWELGIFLGQAQMPYAAPWPEWTVVLVESPEHGDDLARRLPEWEFLHAMSGTLEADPAATKSIVTLVAASQLDLFAPDVLINAIAGDWVFKLDNHDAPSRDRRAVVVDIADDFDQVAERATQNRLRQHYSRGWTISPEKYSLPWSRTGSR